MGASSWTGQYLVLAIRIHGVGNPSHMGLDKASYSPKNDNVHLTSLDLPASIGMILGTPEDFHIF
jgi:hypothetical protein